MVKLETIIERAKRVILRDAISILKDYDDYLTEYTTPIDALTKIIISRDDDKSIRQEVVEEYIGEDPFCWLFLKYNEVDANDYVDIEYPDGEVITAQAQLKI